MIDFDSVVEGQDADWFPGAVRFYTKMDDPLVLDVTWGAGRFWKKNDGLRVIGLDLRPLAEIRGDCHCLPIKESSVDVVVYDPPHLRRPDVMGHPYGQEDLYGDMGVIVDISMAFLEAARVLRPGGTLLFKIADEPSRSRWHTVSAFHAAEEAELNPFDLVIKKRGRAIINRTQKQHRARKCHCFYWIYKKPWR